MTSDDKQRMDILTKIVKEGGRAVSASYCRSKCPLKYKYPNRTCNVLCIAELTHTTLAEAAHKMLDESSSER